MKHAKISTQFDTQKLSVALFIIHNDKLLMQTEDHQGEILWNTFGTFLVDEDPYEKIMTIQKEQLGTSFKVTPCAEIISYIKKPEPDGRVELITQVYSLHLTDDEATSLKLKDNQFWTDSDAIMSTKSVREDDKLILSRVLKNENINLVIDVDQMGKWIEGKLLNWEEKPV